MASDKPENDSFLAIIEKKIAALRALADSYRHALSLGALGQPGERDAAGLSTPSSGRSDGPIDLPQGALLGKSLPAAVKLWLTSVRKKQSVREIANALKDGGVESTSPNFENVITGALHRLKANNEVLRFKDGWALAELYPASLRSSLAKDAKPAKTSNVTGRGKKARKSTPKTATHSQKPTVEDPVKTSSRRESIKPTKDKTAAVLGLLTGDRGASASDLHVALQAMDLPCEMNYVYAVLHRLKEQEKAEKRRDGLWYRLESEQSSAA